MTATNNAILKSDRRGRLRYSAEQKAAMVEAYQISGLSGPRFAALHGVNYQTLAGWLQKRKQHASPIISRPPHPAVLSLVEAEIQAMPPAGAMELILPGGAKLTLTAPGQIPLAAALIRELANPRPC
jgi:transposase-like protein